MRHETTSTGEQLVNALHALGVNFVMGGKGKDESLHKQPGRLIAALAQSDEARLRLSLIPLFLIPNMPCMSAGWQRNSTWQHG